MHLPFFVNSYLQIELRVLGLHWIKNFGGHCGGITAPRFLVWLSRVMCALLMKQELFSTLH